MINFKLMDIVMSDIITLFNSDEVELVRLNGLYNQIIKLGLDISINDLDNIINKLKDNSIINYKFITICPYCQEKTYQIKEISNNSKICDTCGSLYTFNDFTRINN